MSQTNNPSVRANPGSHIGATRSTTATTTTSSSLTIFSSNTSDLTYSINRYVASPIYSTPPFHRERSTSTGHTYNPDPQDELAKELESMGKK